MNKVKQAVEFKAPIWNKFDKDGNQMYYEVTWFCNENKITHPTLKSRLNCKVCTPVQDKIEYEAIKRTECFINDYEIHNIWSTFSKISTENLCKLYNVKMNYFRPWI